MIFSRQRTVLELIKSFHDVFWVFFRLCGVNLLAEEGPGWWPDVDLIEHYGLKDYEDSKWETMLLGHKPDGREGLLIPSIPPYVQKNGADGKGNYGSIIYFNGFHCTTAVSINQDLFGY